MNEKGWPIENERIYGVRDVTIDWGSGPKRLVLDSDLVDLLTKERQENQRLRDRVTELQEHATRRYDEAVAMRHERDEARAAHRAACEEVARLTERLDEVVSAARELAEVEDSVARLILLGCLLESLNDAQRQSEDP